MQRLLSLYDEMTCRNASKFDIFYIYKNTKMFFTFFILCYFILYTLKNILVYVYIDKSIHCR